MLKAFGILEARDANNPEHANLPTVSEIADALFPEDESADPTLNNEIILQAAQAYSMPFLKDKIEKDLQPHFKGKYINDFLGKVAAASGGLLKRSDFADGTTVEQALKMYSDKLKEIGGKNNEEMQQMVEALNVKLAGYEGYIAPDEHNRIINEFTQKESVRTIKEAMLADMAKRQISVQPGVASDAVYGKLSERFHVVYDAEKKKFNLMDKADPTKPAKASDTAFADYETETGKLLNDYNWMKKSNGGGGANPDPEKQRQPYNGGFNNPMKLPNQQGGNGGQQQITRSPLGQALEKHGHIESPGGEQ